MLRAFEHTFPDAGLINYDSFLLPELSESLTAKLRLAVLGLGGGCLVTWLFEKFTQVLNNTFLENTNKLE